MFNLSWPLRASPARELRRFRTHWFLVEQANRLHRERCGKLVQDIDSGIAARALNLADVGAINLRFQRQTLLGKLSQEPDFSNISRDELA